MELKDLVGRHTLTGVETGTEEFDTWHDEKETRDYILFELDGITYKATENPDDGYRSYMDDLELSLETCKTRLPDVPVYCRMRPDDENWYESNDVLEFYDIRNGLMVLAVGTANNSDYYPWCVLEYKPENIACNVTS